MEEGNRHIALKHIYFINKYSRASQYGIGSYIKQVVKFLQPTGCKITIINFSSIQKDPKIEKIDGIESFYLPYPTYIGAEKFLSRYYQAVVTFLELHIDKNSDNIFHFNYLMHFPLCKAIKEKFSNCQTLLTVHYFDWHFVLKGNTTQFLQIIKKKEHELSVIEKEIIKDYNQNKLFFEEVDNIICLAHYTKHLLMQQYDIEESKMHIVRNAVSSTNVKMLTTEEKVEKRRQLHIGTEEKIILFVGRLDALKGIEFLVEAFQKVLEAVPNSRLWIVGDGEYDIGLNKAENIWNRITLTGKISQDTLFTLYQIANIGVIPSFCEQCSYVAVEMMQFGLPIIGTTANGLKEMLAGGKLVELTETQEDVYFPVEQLSQYIANALSDVDSLRQIYKEQECYSIEIMQTKMINLYMIN